MASNELLEQLDKQLGAEHKGLRDSHPAKTLDKRQQHRDSYPFNGEPNMAYSLLKQSLGKQFDPRIESSDLPEMMELDMATAQALNNH